MNIRFPKLTPLAVLLALAVYPMCSCGSEETVCVPAKMALENADETGMGFITFSNRSETKQVSFTADGDWYIRIPKGCDWLSVSPSSGKGDATVNFTTSTYDATTSRSVNVAFVCDNIEQKALLQVTQMQRFFLEPSVLSDVLPKNGGEVTVNVSTNGTFKCEIDQAGSSWLSIVSQDEGKVVLNASPIAETAAKNKATLTFTCIEDPGVTAAIDLSQKNLAVTINAKEVISDGHSSEGDLDITLLNVTNWVPEADQPWVTVTRDGDKIHFSLAANPYSSDRTALISAVCADSEEDKDVKGVVTVTQYAAADLMDFKFNKDGTAEDISPLKNTVNSWTKGATMNYYEDFSAWGPSVSRGLNKSLNKADYAFWECEYAAFDNRINNGYTIEAVFSIPVAHTNVETKAFGATQSGGFALMLGATGEKTNAGDGSKTTRDGSIEFIQHGNGNWNFAVSHVQPVPGQLYHVFGVWDCETIKCYVDGKLTATVGVTALKHKSGLHCMGVAGNYSSETKFNGSWNGTVVVARLYDNPLTAEQIKAKTELKGTLKIVK